MGMTNGTSGATPGTTQPGPELAAGTGPDREHETLRRLARGEEAALAELYDVHAPMVYGLALRLLDGDEEAAGNVLTGVFADVWDDPRAYAPERGPLRSLLADLTHRRAVRSLGRPERGAREPGGGPGDRAEERARAASAAARADRVVTAMPGPLRTTLELAYERHRDYREAAAELGVSEDETRRRLRLGLQLLSTAAATGHPGPGAAGPGGGAEEPGGGAEAGSGRAS